MEFYTNVTKYGNKLLVRGVKNGIPYKSKVDFSPTMYIKSNKESEWRTLFGETVSEVKFADINDAREFIEKYKEVESFSVFGNANYAHQYISDNYSSNIPYDVEKIKIFSIDIEVGAESGCPSVQAVDEEVLLITIQDNHTKEITTFGSRDFIGEEGVRYVKCNNETHLLKEFVIFWQTKAPDIITGWTSTSLTFRISCAGLIVFSVTLSLRNFHHGMLLTNAKFMSKVMKKFLLTSSVLRYLIILTSIANIPILHRSPTNWTTLLSLNSAKRN